MEFEIVSGSYDGLVQGFCVDALDPGTQVCKPGTIPYPISYPSMPLPLIPRIS